MNSFITKLPEYSEVLERDPVGMLIAELWYQDRRGGKYTVELWLHEMGVVRFFRLHNAILPVETFTCPYVAVNALRDAYEKWILTPDHFPLDMDLLDRV